jgi:ribosomal protein S2
MSKLTFQDLLDAGVHFGHQKKKVEPCHGTLHLR